MQKDKIDYNVASYERHNRCSECNGELLLTGKSSSSQTFVCKECQMRFRLYLIDNHVELIGKVEKTREVIRSPYKLKGSTQSAGAFGGII